MEKGIRIPGSIRWIKAIALFGVVIHLFLIAILTLFTFQSPTDPFWQGFIQGVTNKLVGEEATQLDLQRLGFMVGILLVSIVPYILVLIAIHKATQRWRWVALGVIGVFGLAGILLGSPPVLPLLLLLLLTTKSARNYFET